MFKKTLSVFLIFLTFSQPLLPSIARAENNRPPEPLGVVDLPGVDISEDKTISPDDAAEEAKADQQRAYIEAVSSHHADISGHLVDLYGRAMAFAENLKNRVGIQKYIAMLNREEVVIFEPPAKDVAHEYKAEVKLLSIDGKPFEFVRVVHYPSGFAYIMFDKANLPEEYSAMAYDDIPRAIDELVENESHFSQLRARQHVEANHKGRDTVFVMMDSKKMVGGKEYLRPSKLTGKYWKEYWQDIKAPITKADVSMAAFFAVINGSIHYGLNYVRYLTQDVPMDMKSGIWSFVFPMFIGSILGTFNNWTMFPRDDVYPDKKRDQMSARDWLASKKPGLIRDMKRSTSSISFATLVTTQALMSTDPTFVTLTFWQKFGTVASMVIPGFIVSRSISRAWDTINIIRKEARQDVSNIKLNFRGKEYDTGWKKIRFQSQIINLAPVPLKIIDYTGFTTLTVFPFHVLHHLGLVNLPGVMEKFHLGLPMAQMATFPMAVYGALRVIDKIVGRMQRDPDVPAKKIHDLENTVDYTFQRWLGVLATNPVSLYGSIYWLENKIIPKKMKDSEVPQEEINVWKHRLEAMKTRWSEGFGIPPLRWARKIMGRFRSQGPDSESGVNEDASQPKTEVKTSDCESKLSA